MKRTILFLAFLVIACSAFAQVGDSHIIYGYQHLSDGMTYPTDLGFEFWKDGADTHFYFNYPEHENTAIDSGYNAEYGLFWIQISVVGPHAAGDIFHVKFIDNTTGQHLENCICAFIYTDDNFQPCYPWTLFQSFGPRR